MADELQYYDIPEIFAKPLLVAEVDRLRDLMKHEGWDVLCRVVKVDAIACLKNVLDMSQPLDARNASGAVYKTMEWMLSLDQRLTKAINLYDPISEDALQSQQPDEDAQDSIPTASDVVLSRL